MNGTIFNIQKFSINDGPGIRTTVFMKGCPLSCIWCHNPESNKVGGEIFYNPERCVCCGRCVAECKNCAHSIADTGHLLNRDKCIGCGECAKLCPSGALESVGRVISSEEVITEVMKDKIFYETSGGGMTLSGGEPMAQFDFCLELLVSAKKNGLHTCMETCGFAKGEHYEKVAPFVDIFLFDYKETDPKLHKEFTGADNSLILKNLFALDALGAKTVLRCPIIPTCNDREEHFKGIADTANALKNIIEINVEPYHPLGESKSRNLGKSYPLSGITFPEEETVKEWMMAISEKTKIPVKRG